MRCPALSTCRDALQFLSSAVAWMPACLRADTMLGASGLSCLGATHVLAGPAPAMCLAVGRATSGCLGAAQVLAASASSVRHTVFRVASSGLGTAHVLAPPSPAMCLAVARVALSGLGTALLLASPASSVRDAVRRATIASCLGTPLLLASFAPAMRLAELRAACSNPLGTALPSRLTPLWFQTPNSLRHAITAVTHPLSVLNAPLVHTGHHPHDGGSARAGQTLGSVSVKMVKSAWAGDVRWVCSRAGWTGTPPHPPPPGSQAASA